MEKGRSPDLWFFVELRLPIKNDSGIMQFSSPFTVAGPCRILTELPFSLSCERPFSDYSYPLYLNALQVGRLL